ncbi:MAG: hypothetical protein FJ278_08415, partial [Planctomycetes bacterium]|nr:hypothetical protein [Planctomycetota bacterium]
GCKERFEKDEGVTVAQWPDDVLTGDLGAKFRDWRCFQITRLVKAVSEEAHKLKPHVKVSAAVWGEWRSTRTSIGQDSRLWIEKGYLDFVCPMDYTPDLGYLRKLVTMQVDAVDGRMPLYIGLGAYQQPNEAALLDQVALSRWLGGDGFVLFQYDLNTATAHLPALREGATSAHASMPHHAPEVLFTYPKGLRNLAEARTSWFGKLWAWLFRRAGAAAKKSGKQFEGLTLKERTKVLVGVQLIPKGNFRKPVKAAAGDVSVEALSGEPVKGFKAWKPWFGGGWRVKFRPPPGSFRVVVAGKVAFHDGTSQPFAVKSRVIRILSRASLAELAAREGPPKVSGPGTRVGLWHDGHGARPILDALKLMPGLNPFFIYNFDEATLDVCQVLVLPQARNASDVDAEARLRIRKWVESGGRLLVTHAAVGYRGHEPIVPDVCLGGLEAPRRTACLVVADHPLTKNLPLNTRFEHSYFDHITLSRGASGAVVVADAADKSPVVIVGECGKGRVVASGMATGITKGDADCPPTGGELQVLLNAIGWLAE